MGKITEGDTAPDFELPAQTGETVRLSDYRGDKAVVLYFYPKDETPICTKEACSFRDSYEDFAEVGAVVIGASSDSVDSHRNFAENHRLPFLLVSDKGGKLRKEYGVPKTLGLMPGRVTYVIDKQGTVRHVFNSQLASDKHKDEALRVVRELS